MVFIEGRLSEPKPYQGRDGEWRASLDVTAQTVKFLGGRGDISAEVPQADQTGEAPPVDEEEIPF